MGNKKRVPLLNKVAYGVGTGGGCVFNQIAAAFLLNYYTDTALIGASDTDRHCSSHERTAWTGG